MTSSCWGKTESWSCCPFVDAGLILGVLDPGWEEASLAPQVLLAWKLVGPFQKCSCWHWDVKITARSVGALTSAFRAFFYNVGTVLFIEKRLTFPLCCLELELANAALIVRFILLYPPSPPPTPPASVSFCLFIMVLASVQLQSPLFACFSSRIRLTR